MENTTPHYLDELDRPIWGARRIAEEAGRTERQIYHLTARGHLDVSVVGNRLVSTPRRIRRSLGIEV